MLEAGVEATGSRSRSDWEQEILVKSTLAVGSLWSTPLMNVAARAWRCVLRIARRWRSYLAQKLIDMALENERCAALFAVARAVVAQ